MNKLLDLVLTKNGDLSQTKLAAACFHFLIFITVAYLTFIHQRFDVEMWSLYAAVAVGHAVVDKVQAQVKDFKDNQLSATSPQPPPMTTVSVTQVSPTPIDPNGN